MNNNNGQKNAFSENFFIKLCIYDTSKVINNKYNSTKENVINLYFLIKLMFLWGKFK